PAVVDVDYTIVAGHAHPIGAALHVWPGNTLNLHQSLFAANGRDTNVDGNPGGTPGTITGLSSCLQAASAGFVAPGAPEHNYHLLSSSPAIDQALDSTTTVDVDGEARPQGPAPDIGADEVVLLPLTVQVHRLESGSLALSWQLAPSLLGYLDHYEIQVSAEAGASPPREGDLESPIDVGEETTFVLTGLTDGKDYVIQIEAHDGSDTVFADGSVTASPMRVSRIFLPLTMGE
ncbi:MAG: fibronectin type III domain-containing protein, partial [Anaerolineae bacterium]